MYYKRLFIAIFFVWLIFILILIFLAVKPNQKPNTVSAPVSPTTSLQAPITSFVRSPSVFPTLRARLQVIGTEPSDEEKNVDPMGRIVINFNSAYDFHDLKIALQPSAPFALFSGANNALIISPILGLSDATSYTLTIFEKSSARELTSFSFTTSKTADKSIDTGPSVSDIRQYYDQMAKEKPDYFLQNFVPLQTENFLLKSLDFDEKSQKFRFEVKLEPGGTREEVENFLLGLGIERASLVGLEIEYK